MSTAPRMRALEILFGESQAALRPRRLDRAALDAAALASGFGCAREALIDAGGSLDSTRPVADTLLGQLPPSLLRLAIARTLGVSEFLLWPVVVQS